MQADDIASAMRLKEAAGWNQTPMDWERLLRLEPDGCFVDERDEVIAGSATALRHGCDIAWIGMVLVLPEFRRRGIARGLMRHCLRWLTDQGIRVSRLDATEMGRPLYVELGFRDEAFVERWERPPVAAHAAGYRREEDPAGFSEAEAALDQSAHGYDRSVLMHDLAADGSIERIRSASGFAFGRPGSGAWFLGPCTAVSEDAAGALVARLLRGHESQRIFWDFLPSNEGAARLGRRLGFCRIRRLVRMVRQEKGGAAPDGRQDRVFATAGFEFG